MSDKRAGRGIFYLDVVAAALGALFVIAQVHAHRMAAAPPLFGDTVGFWIPAIAAVLWLVGRRRACTASASWPAAAGGGVLLAALAVLCWRWGVTAFMGGVVSASLLLAAGLALRARRLSDRLSRLDWFGLVAAVGAVLVTLVLTEGVLRLVPGVFSPEVRQIMEADVKNYGVSHPYIGYLHRPNVAIELTGRDFHAVHHVDGLGFRNGWPWPAHADIVTVGDSLTFGYGVSDDEAWPAMVARAMAPARLINLGLVGAGPQQYLRLYQTFGEKLTPKLLIVGFFGQNDFWDAGMFDRWLASGVGGNYMVWRDFGQPVKVHFSLRAPLESLDSLVRGIAYPLTRRTYLFNLLRALRGAEAGAPPVAYHFADGHQVQLFEDDFRSKRALGESGTHEFQLTIDALGQLQTLANEEGAHLLVVLQPGKEEVYLPLMSHHPVADTTTALRPALDKLGVEYLDLDPAFRAQAATGQQLFYEVDGHPNQAGYALTAQLVTAYLKDHAERLGLTAAAAAQ